MECLNLDMIQSDAPTLVATPIFSNLITLSVILWLFTNYGVKKYGQSKFISVECRRHGALGFLFLCPHSDSAPTICFQIPKLARRITNKVLLYVKPQMLNQKPIALHRLGCFAILKAITWRRTRWLGIIRPAFPVPYGLHQAYRDGFQNYATTQLPLYPIGQLRVSHFQMTPTKPIDHYPFNAVWVIIKNWPLQIFVCRWAAQSVDMWITRRWVDFLCWMKLPMLPSSPYAELTNAWTSETSAFWLRQRMMALLSIYSNLSVLDQEHEAPNQ